MPNNWWLDIETANLWNGNTSLNASVIKGAINRLSQPGMTIGIYSTKYQWTWIAGNFNPGLPNWVAGAPDLATAPSYCTLAYAFGGGTVWLVQYPNAGYDGDYAC